jgi:hypothetical protein
MRTALCPDSFKASLGHGRSSAIPIYADDPGDFRDPKAELEWESIDDDGFFLDRKTLLVSMLFVAVGSTC